MVRDELTASASRGDLAPLGHAILGCTARSSHGIPGTDRSSVSPRGSLFFCPFRCCCSCGCCCSHCCSMYRVCVATLSCAVLVAVPCFSPLLLLLLVVVVVVVVLFVCPLLHVDMFHSISLLLLMIFHFVRPLWCDAGPTAWWWSESSTCSCAWRLAFTRYQREDACSFFACSHPVVIAVVPHKAEIILAQKLLSPTHLAAH